MLHAYSIYISIVYTYAGINNITRLFMHGKQSPFKPEITFGIDKDTNTFSNLSTVMSSSWDKH
jgi:hypothetical protein